MLSDNMKILFGIIVVLGLLYYINKSSEKNKKISNSDANTECFTGETGQAMDPNYPATIYGDSFDHLDVQNESPPSRGGMALKPSAKKLPLGGNAVASKEDGENEWEIYFGNRPSDNLQIRSTNGNFKPLDETNGQYAMYDQPMKKYKPSKVKNPEDDDGSFDPDMYDPDNLLPQENDLNYFEVIDSQVSLKGRLLRPENPLGINTVGQSKRFASHDLRPVPLCPKFGVSPWNNSSAEPDVNIKTLY